jgi:hypothetical protein
MEGGFVRHGEAVDHAGSGIRERIGAAAEVIRKPGCRRSVRTAGVPCRVALAQGTLRALRGLACA